MRVAISNTTGHAPPRVPFSKMKDLVLGKQYKLSMVFATPPMIRKLNRQYRHRDSSTDILSFALNKGAGELYVSMPDVRRQAPKFSLAPKQYCAYLIVHGLLHLSGLDHGNKMAAAEKHYCKRLKIKHPDDMRVIG